MGPGFGGMAPMNGDFLGDAQAAGQGMGMQNGADMGALAQPNGHNPINN